MFGRRQQHHSLSIANEIQKRENSVLKLTTKTPVESFMAFVINLPCGGGQTRWVERSWNKKTTSTDEMTPKITDNRSGKPIFSTQLTALNKGSTWSVLSDDAAPWCYAERSRRERSLAKRSECPLFPPKFICFARSFVMCHGHARLTWPAWLLPMTHFAPLT